MITTSETYKKKGIEQYRARQYEDAVSSFDQAITLGDRSIFIYDMKITSLSKADMTVLKPGDEGYQARALHAVEAIIKKFEKHQDVWKLHYRKGDILYRKSLFSQSLQTLNSAILATEKLPTGARIASRDIIKKLQKQVSDVMARHRAQALKSKADAAEAISAEASIKARIAAKARANWFATALPPEILVMICKYGLVTDCSFNSRMAGVCPAWRQVITGEKALWQELALGGKYPHKKAALWARYCQGTLREVKFGPNFSTGRLETVSNILEPLVPTIRGLEIHANIGDSILDWRHRFAELTHLMVTCQQYSNKEDHPIPRMCPFQLDYDLCVPGAKSLRTIHLANGRYSFPSRPLPHRGSGMVQSDDPGSEDEGQCYDDSTLVNVTSLKLKNCHFTAGDAKDTFTRGLLNWMRNLEDIDLETVRFADLIPLGPNGSMPRNDRVDNVSLTNLRRYRENGVPRSQVGPLFDELNAPSLRELAISQTYMRSTAQLLHKGFDPSILTSLDISRLILTHSDVVDFLRKTPALRFLNVSLCGLEDPFLKALEHVDAMDDQLLPFLEALSICGSNISGGAVRDFVNSRLTYEKRIPVMRASDETKPKLKSAFGPTSKSKPKVEPLISLAPLSTQTTGKLDMTIFSTQPGTPSNRPNIKWLCLDECTGIDPVYITLLKKHVKYVSCWLGTPNEDRQKGLGRWNWDGDIETCVDIADQSCFMRQYEPGRWTIVHTCKKAIAESEEEEKGKGWTRSSQLPSSSFEAFR